MFIDEKGKELLEKHLYRNFLLHCCNMHEYNVLSPGQVFTAFTQLQRYIRDNNLQHNLNHWEAQLKRAFEQKGQVVPKDALDLVLPSAEVSPNCQRSDFSGIFKKEGKLNLNASPDKKPYINSSSTPISSQSPNISCPSSSLQQEAHQTKVSQEKEVPMEKLGQSPKLSLANNLVASPKSPSTPSALPSSIECNGTLLKNINTIDQKDNSNGCTNTNEPNKGPSYPECSAEKVVKPDSLVQSNGLFKSKEIETLLNSSANLSAANSAKNIITSCTSTRNATQLATASTRSTSHQSPTSKKS